MSAIFSGDAFGCMVKTRRSHGQLKSVVLELFNEKEATPKAQMDVKMLARVQRQGLAIRVWFPRGEEILGYTADSSLT
ncbi:hypothetical protein PM082_011920 [Marasmius tenuissimus]|nr:hypothetical protein PM082_011920 [Marasmius tenuissimus]